MYIQTQTTSVVTFKLNLLVVYDGETSKDLNRLLQIRQTRHYCVNHPLFYKEDRLKSFTSKPAVYFAPLPQITAWQALRSVSEMWTLQTKQHKSMPEQPPSCHRTEQHTRMWNFPFMLLGHLYTRKSIINKGHWCKQGRRKTWERFSLESRLCWHSPGLMSSAERGAWWINSDCTWVLFTYTKEPWKRFDNSR